MTPQREDVEAVARAMSRLDFDRLDPDGETITYWRQQAQAAITAATPFIERELFKRMMEYKDGKRLVSAADLNYVDLEDADALEVFRDMLTYCARDLGYGDA